MKENLKSWEFLFDFYQHDKSIVDLINQALSVSSNIKVRHENFDILIEDILSLFPNNTDKKSYEDFLSYVIPNNSQEDFIETEDLENKLLQYIRVNIEQYLPPNTISDKHIPYLILYSVNITQDWFLYGKDYAFYGNSLQKAYKRWRISFYFNKHYIFSKLFWTKQLSAVQLFSLATLFIVLRREWTYSKKWNNIYSKKWKYSDRWDQIRANNYASLKYNYLNDTYSTKTGLALIYSLYHHFKDADEEIKQKINISKENDKIPTIELHPLVAKHIIESNAYQFLFDMLQYMTPLDEKDNYFLAEDRLDKEEKIYGTRKRFLVDYMFPYTEIRENDIFEPSSAQLTDYIFLSFHKGKSYKSILRNPEENEKFDVIQIKPNINTSGEYVDNRVIVYRKDLKPQGEFDYVLSSEEYNVKEKLKKAFSDFRHDLKGVMPRVTINNLQHQLSTTISYTEEIRNIIINIECFINAPTEDPHCDTIMDSIIALDNNSELQKTINNPFFGKIVYDIRKLIDIYRTTHSNESLKSIPKHINDLKSILIEFCINTLSKSIELTDNIEYSHNTLSSYIQMAGNSDRIEKNDHIKICEFLGKYIGHTTSNTKRASLLYDYSNVERNCAVKTNKAAMTVILNSIIDNAFKHGFENYDCDSPTIKFILQDQGEYLLLKICNNGRPIDITNVAYKARGIFSGITGHTGLGGYRISQYAEILGGYVEIPENKEWNTEIHLYIKK